MEIALAMTLITLGIAATLAIIRATLGPTSFDRVSPLFLERWACCAWAMFTSACTARALSIRAAPDLFYSAY